MSRETRIPAGEFKARCLALLDDVDRGGTEIVVTKRGRPVARVVPIVAPPSLLGSVTAPTDLIAPLGDSWDAER